MAVSANTLFHFTKIGSLKSILSSQGFFCQYSDEHFENILPKRSFYRFVYIPMVSFCDLTITQLSNDSDHRKNFGEYGIGLTKEWGIKNQVSPVMYVHRLSQTTSQLSELISTFKGFHKAKENFIDVSSLEDELVDFFKYIKPYRGIWHKGKKIKYVRNPIIYYNEREWRYCPKLKDQAILSAIIKENKRQKEKLNADLRGRMLKFKSEDIKFILIKNKRDISAMAKVITSMNIPIAQKNELITKIITFEEIKEDY